MTTFIANAREALQTGLRDTIRTYRYNPEQLNPPCAVIGFPTSYDPNAALADAATFTIPVSVYVPYAASRAAEEALETYVASVVDAVHAIGSEYAVPQVRDFGVLENATGVPTALGCVIDVLILA